MVEYGIYKSTGRKVEGMTGRVWTWAWIFLLSWKTLEDEVNNGQLEGFRPKIEVWGVSLYPLDHVVEWLIGDRVDVK